jgi:hypothetical protein
VIVAVEQAAGVTAADLPHILAVLAPLLEEQRHTRRHTLRT